MFPDGILVMSGSTVPPLLKSSAFLWRMARARRTEPRQVSRWHESIHYGDTAGNAREEVRSDTAAAETPAPPRAEEGHPPAPPDTPVKDNLPSTPSGTTSPY